MKKKFLALMLSALMIGTTACGGSSEKTDDTSKNMQANEEVTGKIRIYTSMYEDIIANMKPALKKKFPNCEIEFFQGGTGTLQTKIAGEIDAGKLACDIIMVAEPSYAYELKEKKVLHKFDIENKDKLAFEYDKEGYWYPVRISNMVLAYNPEKTKKEDLAQTFKEFAEKESLTGKISMSDPLKSGTALAAISGLKDKYKDEYFTNLAKRKVAIEAGSVALTKLETGEMDELMILEESVLKKRQDDNSSLEVIYPKDGTIVVPSPIMVVDEKLTENKNTKAAEAISKWFLSEEGQKYIVKGWMHSVLKDFPEVPYDAIKTSEITSNSINVKWEQLVKDRDSLRKMFTDTIGKK